MKRVIVCCCLLALGLAGCNKEEKKPQETAKEQPEKKAEPKKVEKPKEPPIELSRETPKTKLDIPTVAELEEEAKKEIKPENLEAELDRLEAEIVGVPN